MELSKHLIIIMTLLFLRSLQLLQAHPSPKRSNLFREYIGAELAGVKFSDVPINPNVDFHFILSFAIDYDATSSPTNGRFNVFWDSDNLGPSQVASLKRSHPNVRVAVSLGGDTVGDGRWAYFSPASVESWVSNAASSLTRLAGEYGLDGIDVDYEHFSADPRTFAECIGRLILNLKRNGVISFASIAPFDDGRVQAHYLALWERYGRWIDYVNFQFYAYDRSTTVSQFLEYFDEQSSKYRGGKLLVSLISDGSGGLSPEKGFFEACDRLKREKRLHGIFIWSADDSKKNGFRYETRSQALLA